MYLQGDGPDEVTAESILLQDADRNKGLYVKVTYPVKGGPYPVIVFSHGAGASMENYLGLTHYWATHGYVCLQPTHDDSIALRRTRGERVPESVILDKVHSDARGWVDRAQDISFVLDSLATLDELLPALKGKLDRKQVGMGGHSYGAYTTELIGGAVIELPDREGPQNFEDDRVKALLVMSGQGHGTMGLSEASFRSLKLPLMVMTGSLDTGYKDRDPSWREEPYQLSPPGGKYLVFVEGANHFTFSGSAMQGEYKGRLFHRAPASSGEQQTLFDYIKSASLAFWDAYLRQDKTAQAWLDSRALPEASHGAVKLEHK